MPTKKFVESPSAKLINALTHSDECSRVERATRIEWLGQFSLAPGSLIQGPVETLQLLQESKDCFVSGHFVATLILSLGYIDHALVALLDDKGHKTNRLTLSAMIALAKTHKLMDGDVLDRTELLQKRRNPFVHSKAAGHEHSLSTRYLEEQRHPDSVLQDDAEEALRLSNLFFRRTTNFH